MTGQADRPNDTTGDPGGTDGTGRTSQEQAPAARRKAGLAGWQVTLDKWKAILARWQVTLDKWKAVASRYALLPLRLFLGITFVYAGLDKLTDSSFFADQGSGSIGETMRAVRDTSAIPGLVDLALKNPSGFGYAIACGELAVGIGTLLGLFARVAALGGALISLSLWLTVSWQVKPYYFGNDLAYLMAWLPLLLAGASVLSLDKLLADRRRRIR